MRILQDPRRQARVQAFASFGLCLSLTACTKDASPQSSVAGSPDPVASAATPDTPDTPDTPEMNASGATARPVSAEPESPRPSVGPGVAVGEAAPSFSLTAADASTVTLAGLVGQAPVALVFFRSADW